MSGLAEDVRLVLEFIRHGFIGAVRSNESKLGAILRGKLYGTRCYLDTGVFIAEGANFEAAPDSALYHGCYIANAKGRFVLGAGSHLGPFCFVNAGFGSVTIGSHVAVGPGTRLFSYSNHYARGTLVTDERLTADISIGDNVFIGANCVILPGTRIPDRVVVGAASVVRGELQSNSIYAGAPARLIRSGWHG